MNRRTPARALAAVTVGLLVLAASPPSSVAVTLWKVGLGAGNSAMAGSVTIPAAPGKPTAVCDFIIGSTIDVSWNAVAGARGYSLYRNGTILKTFASSTLSYKDGLVSLIGSYYYTVTADIVSGKWTSPQSPKSDSHSIVLFVGCV